MAAPPSNGPSFVLYAALAVLFVVSVSYQIPVTQSRVDELRHGDTLADFPLDLDPPLFDVVSETDDSKAAGIRPGDRVIRIGGRPVRGTDDLYLPVLQARPGERIVLDLQPPSGSGRPDYTASLPLHAMHETPPGAWEWVGVLVAGALLPTLCLALGFWVAVVRIRDPLAWLLLLLLLGLSQFGGLSWRDLFGHPGWLRPLAAVYQPVFANLWPLSMMLFGIYFPERLAFDRRHPYLKWMVIAPLLFRVLGTNVVTDIAMRTDAALAFRVDATFGWMRPVAAALHLTAILIFFAALGYKMLAERQPDARRRLRLLVAGGLMAVVPVVAAIILAFIGLIELKDEMVPLLLAMLFVFPLTMAYVIVVERALDVRLVVRQGMQYLLARGSVRLLQIGGSIAIFFLAVDRFNVRGDSALRFVPIVVGVACIVAIGRFGDRLRRWVDRRFFREAYDAEQLLAELATQVRTMVETRPLLEMVANQVASALHVPRLAILLNSGGVLEPAFALGYGAIPPLPAPAEAESISSSSELRSALGAELVLPLSANKKLVGVMGLGPKRSEEPFTSSDVRLLDAVATQTGLALENSRLTAEVAAEIANREKRKREMEIAREVQQRLFPQATPTLKGLQVAGACRPALEVGGDYYDFVPLACGRLGIAIGDISGKGIPASLLMATLRAYLRSQATHAQQDLPVMMANLNALVYESSDSNRYATFFYGRYDPETRVLDYVNAGHNPPMIFRNWGRTSLADDSPGQVIRLETGGPVIGLLPAWTYEQGSVTLCPGDVFVSFTDGVSEAMNSEMEEWGEERLIETVTPACEVPLQDLIARIMAGADAHTGSAPQHDDMTLVVARCE